MTSSLLRILTRADDAGLNSGTNQGIALAVTKGVARNISVLANGPALDDAVARLRHLDACFGFHACLTSEWETTRWGSLTQASALHESDGTFPRDWAGLQRLDPPTEIVLAEMAAQLQCLREAGFVLTYLDEHMFISGALPRLRPALEEFARREGLIYRMELPVVPSPGDGGGPVPVDPTDRFLHRLRATSPGTYVEITHPAVANPEMQQLHLRGQAPGVVSRDRDREVHVLTSPGVREFFASGHAQAIRYDQL